jgi:flagellar biosynthesis protein FlhB
LSPFTINKKNLFLFKKRKPKSIKKKTQQTSQKLKMPSSHSLPNSLLLLIVLLVTIFFGNVNSTFVHYSGHVYVYCNVSTAADGTSNTAEGSLVLPVKNVYMALMEADGWFFLQFDNFIQ